MVSSTKRSELERINYQQFSDYKKNLIRRYENGNQISQFSLPWDKNKTGQQERAGYLFLNSDDFLTALIEDFNQIESIIDLPKGGVDDKVVALARYLYGHYANLLLSNETFYNKPDEIIRYKAIVKNMSGLIPHNKDGFNRVMDELGESLGVPYFSKTVLNALGLLNVNRLSTVFSRLSWKETWLLCRFLGILDQFDNVFGQHINIGILDAPTDLFNGLSVGIFAARFLVHFSLASKHYYFPTDAEKALSPDERWDIEFNKRYTILVNDGVWTLVNLLTNYSWFFHISGPVAGAMLALFLGFDIYWLAHQLDVAEKAYFTKEAEYQLELKDPNFSPTTLRLLNLQLTNLKNQRYATQAKLMFCLGAAFTLAASFSAALIFGTPLAFIIGYFGCVVGTAMYMTNGKFADYMSARRNSQSNPMDAVKNEACQVAWDKFVKAILKQIFIPILIVGAFTINWPGAILLTVLYIGYECAAPKYLKQNSAMPFIIAGVCLVSWQAALLLTAFYMVYQTAEKQFTHSRLSINTGLPFWEQSIKCRPKQGDDAAELELALGSPVA